MEDEQLFKDSSVIFVEQQQTTCKKRKPVDGQQLCTTGSVFSLFCFLVTSNKISNGDGMYIAILADDCNLILQFPLHFH